MKKLLLLLFVFSISFAVSAQTLKISPFRRMPTAGKNLQLKFGATATPAPTRFVAWRFTAAAAGYDIINNKVLTGIGYGYNSMHINTDAAGNTSYYTDVTANISVYAAGNVSPNYNNGNTNIIGFGPSIGILNKLVNVGYVFYPPSNGSGALSGVLVNIAIPLN